MKSDGFCARLQSCSAEGEREHVRVAAAPGIRAIQLLIVLYRWTISLILGPRCRFHPSCSQYATEALERHGWRGATLSLKRLLRCHPWSPGGLDPVP